MTDLPCYRKNYSLLFFAAEMRFKAINTVLDASFRPIFDPLFRDFPCIFPCYQGIVPGELFVHDCQHHQSSRAKRAKTARRSPKGEAWALRRALRLASQPSFATPVERWERRSEERLGSFDSSDSVSAGRAASGASGAGSAASPGPARPARSSRNSSGRRAACLRP